MNDRERGFLLLTSHLGDPERKVLTAAQLRALALRVRERKPEAEGRELTEKDLTELDYSEEAARQIVTLLSQEPLLDDYLARGDLGLRTADPGKPRISAPSAPTAGSGQSRLPVGKRRPVHSEYPDPFPGGQPGAA